MNLLMEILVERAMFMDLLGLAGLGLLVLASLQLFRRMPGRAAALIAWGAIALLAGRLGFLLSAQILAVFGQEGHGSGLADVIRNLRVALLTAGLGAIVWGFWSHEQELRGK
jgi:hypothetical protein